MTDKQHITEQIVKVQNELERLNKLLQDEPEETITGVDVAWDCIAVTEVKVFPFKNDVNLGHLKGLAQVVLNDQLVIRGLRIMDGLNVLFVSYPTDPFYKGDDLRSIVNPITRQLREHIENCVLEKYQAAIA
jgi:stage V sporulation protein G